MSEHQTTDESDPCERCGAPVHGYVEKRCCDGSECACMGRPLEPCWCNSCWQEWEIKHQENTAIWRGFNE